MEGCADGCQRDPGSGRGGVGVTHRDRRWRRGRRGGRGSADRRREGVGPPRHGREPLVATARTHPDGPRPGRARPPGLRLPRRPTACRSGRGEHIEVKDVGAGGDTGAAGPYPGDDVLGGVGVVDEAQPDRAGTGRPCGGGGLDDDHVGVFADIEAVRDAHGDALGQMCDLLVVIDSGHLRGAAAAVPADDDTAGCRCGGGVLGTSFLRSRWAWRHRSSGSSPGDSLADRGRQDQDRTWSWPCHRGCRRWPGERRRGGGEGTEHGRASGVGARSRSLACGRPSARGHGGASRSSDSGSSGRGAFPVSQWRACPARPPHRCASVPDSHRIPWPRMWLDWPDEAINIAVRTGALPGSPRPSRCRGTARRVHKWRWPSGISVPTPRMVAAAAGSPRPPGGVSQEGTRWESGTAPQR